MDLKALERLGQNWGVSIESLVVLVLDEHITAFVLTGIAPILIVRCQKPTSPPAGSADLWRTSTPSRPVIIVVSVNRVT